MAGGNCSSGAIAGATSELVADYAFNNGSSAKDSILLGQSTGIATSLLASSLQNNSDEQTAKDIQLGSLIGANAAMYNSVSDGIGVSSLEEESQNFKESQNQANEKLKSVKTELQVDLADVAANSDNQIIKGAAFTGLTATNILFPESVEEIGLGVIGAGMTFASRSTTTLYRAVSQAELNDIAKYGFRNNPAGGSYDAGKLFATNANDAVQFGKNNYTRFDQIPNTVIKIKVPSNVMNSSGVYKFPADSMKAIAVYHDSGILLKTKPSILNYSPIPNLKP